MDRNVACVGTVINALRSFLKMKKIYNLEYLNINGKIMYYEP